MREGTSTEAKQSVSHGSIQEWQAHGMAVGRSLLQKGPTSNTKNFVMYPKENENLKNGMLKFSFHKITVVAEWRIKGRSLPEFLFQDR